jgi:hypothetical protein
MAQFWLPKTLPDRAKIAKWVVEDLDRNFDSSFHIFVEFMVPSGRQIDFLIAHSGRKIDSSVSHGKSDATSTRTVDQFFKEWARGSRYLITAPAGIGKTTLCLYLCRNAIKEKLKDRNGPLPVYAEMSDYRRNDGGLVGLIRDALRRGKLKVNDDAGKILEQGHIALFLDGLDEMRPDEFREFLIDARRWFELMKHSIIVITSRPTAHQFDPSLGFDRIELLSFTEAQRKEYLERSNHLDKIAVVSRFGSGDIFRSPLFLSLFVGADRDLILEHNPTAFDAFQAVGESLLRRELARSNEGNEFDAYWADLCEFANRMGFQDATREHVPKSEACEWIRFKRMDPSSEKGYRHLKTLIATSLLKETADHHSVGFAHPLLRSLFLAFHLTDHTHGNGLESLLADRLGQYRPFVNFPGLPRVFIARKSEGLEDVFRFFIARLSRKGDEIQRNRLLDLLFARDPLLAGECRNAMSSVEFEQQIKVALSRTSNRPRLCPPDAKLNYVIWHWSSDYKEVTYEGRWYAHPCLDQLVADETDYQLVVNHGMKKFAPLLLKTSVSKMGKKKPYMILIISAWSSGEWLKSLDSVTEFEKS